MMMGYAAAVTPGAAPYDAIDDDTVVKILDEGRIEQLRAAPGRAHRRSARPVGPRCTARTCRSAASSPTTRPPNPATGEPRTSALRPHAERRLQGRRRLREHRERLDESGAGPRSGSTPAATTATSCRRWHDQGVGQAGRLWTQNFGSGGGARP